MNDIQSDKLSSKVDIQHTWIFEVNTKSITILDPLDVLERL